MANLVESPWTRGIDSIVAGEYLTLQPVYGEDAVIEIIAVGGAAELYITDGTNSIKLDAMTKEDAWIGTYRASNTLYYKVKNVGEAAIKMVAVGRATK